MLNDVSGIGQASGSASAESGVALFGAASVAKPGFCLSPHSTMPRHSPASTKASTLPLNKCPWMVCLAQPS
uniref:Uncharacterized protein n=1 Tax=Rheinheimera sp. BAL341 TaxID=1708203 RepID=A0A486XUN7_9GAMM